MAQERLELVTSFSELRAGLIVVIKDCGRCRGTHRGVLVALTSYGAWEMLPRTSCTLSWEPFCGPDAGTVESKMVYRVVDGLDPEADRRQDNADQRNDRSRKALAEYVTNRGVGVR